MLNRRNLVVLEGGLTRDPEIFNDSVVHLSLACDNSGNEKGQKNAAGYFDCKVWLSESKFTAPAVSESVRSALAEKRLVKGTRVGVIGRLVQERWEKDGSRSSKVVVMIESIDIVPSFAKTGAATESSDSASGVKVQPAYASVPEDF